MEARAGEREGGIRLRKPYYGWYIACLAFISLFIGAGNGGFTFGIFLPAMNEDLGWSRSTIVVGSSLTSITAALAGPLLGRIVDRRGPRIVMIPSVLLMAVALGASSFAQEPWQFYLTFGLMSGVARSALQSVIPGAMIANWFQRRRSAAYGIAAMGPPCSNLFLPLLTALVSGFGWRVGWLGLGSVGLIIGLIPALLLRHRRPEELGLKIDGEPMEPGEAAASSRGAASASGRGEDWTAREAIHSRAFWLVAAGMALILLAPNVSIIFMFSYLSSKGIGPAAAAFAIGSVSAMQVVTRMVFWAPITGRMHSVRWALVLWGGLLLTATLLLAVADNELMAYAGAVVLGLGLGGNLVLQLQVWPEYFGRTSIGTIIGTANMFQGISSAVVPLLLAALLDRTGSYTLLYMVVSGLVLIGLCLHVIVGKPQRRAVVAID